MLPSCLRLLQRQDSSMARQASCRPLLSHSLLTWWLNLEFQGGLGKELPRHTTVYTFPVQCWACDSILGRKRSKMRFTGKWKCGLVWRRRCVLQSAACWSNTATLNVRPWGRQYTERTASSREGRRYGRKRKKCHTMARKRLCVTGFG